MGEYLPLTDEEEEAERLALDRAVAEARADPRRVPHEVVREWLLRIAHGEFDVLPPIPHE